MEIIKNFVDNIHNDDYKESYKTPLLKSEELFFTGGRRKQSLNGDWNFSVDQYDNCLRAKWFLEQETNEEGRSIPLDYGFDDWEKVPVPGVWNLVKPEYFYYEGPAVYSRRFFLNKENGERVFLRFGAVSYEARIFLNGTFLGVHKGGSTPFCVEVTDHLAGENRLIVVADNTRKREQIPSVNTDWFLYGGIYREVSLLFVPNVYIKDFKVHLTDWEKKTIEVNALMEGNGQLIDGEFRFSIPELHIEEIIPVDQNGTGHKLIQTEGLSLWSTENPKRYEVFLSYQEKGKEKDRVTDLIGFRTIETKGRTILLNGSPIYLRGACLHEETEEHGKAVTKEDIREAFKKAKHMNCNFLRLAHYPHTEWAGEIADEEGILLWEEIPVYWWIDFLNKETLLDARNQLMELISRDFNRASVIIWSVGNENPDTDARYLFMKDLAEAAKKSDSTRLISAACLVDALNLRIADRLEQHLDVIGFNEYYGWYDPDYEKLTKILEDSSPDKPVVISEFGADGYMTKRTAQKRFAGP